MNKQNVMQKLTTAVIVASGAVMASSANAAIDLTEVTSSFGDGTTAAATLGGIGLAFYVAVRMFKKIRAAV